MLICNYPSTASEKFLPASFHIYGNQVCHCLMHGQQHTQGL